MNMFTDDAKIMTIINQFREHRSLVYTTKKKITASCPCGLILSKTKNFRLSQIERGLQMKISNWMKMAESSPNGYKKLWEKGKWLITYS